MNNNVSEVLDDVKQLIIKKSNDYQNPKSNIKQIDYYPRGISSIVDIMNAKILRIRSILEATENDPSYSINNESLTDSCMDLISYSAFAVAWLRGQIDGQIPDRDIFNRKRRDESALVSKTNGALFLRENQMCSVSNTEGT